MPPCDSRLAAAGRVARKCASLSVLGFAQLIAQYFCRLSFRAYFDHEEGQIDTKYAHFGSEFYSLVVFLVFSLLFDNMQFSLVYQSSNQLIKVLWIYSLFQSQTFNLLQIVVVTSLVLRNMAWLIYHVLIAWSGFPQQPAAINYLEQPQRKAGGFLLWMVAGIFPLYTLIYIQHAYSSLSLIKFLF